MKAGSCVINTTSLAAYGGSAELLDYSSTEGATVSFMLFYLFVSKVIYRFWILFTLQVVLLSMLDIACCSFLSPWKYGGLLQK
jgi:hypothetical protein